MQYPRYRSVQRDGPLLLSFLELYLHHCVQCCISCNITYVLYVLRETNKLKLKRQCLKIYLSMDQLLTSYVATENRAIKFL